MSDRALALGLAAVALVGYVVLASRRPGLDRVWGDEPTYLAMIQSVGADGDLRFEEADRVRAVAAGPTTTLILQQAGGRVSYSKPILYALFGAPFYALFSSNGLVIGNVLAVGLALRLAFAYLRRLGPAGSAGLTLVTFVGTSAMPAYLAWRMTESLDFALVLAGLVLCCGASRRGSDAVDGDWLASPWAASVGAALLGLAASMRFPNAVLVAAPVATALMARRPGRALRLIGCAAAALVAVTLLTHAMTGALNPYRAPRSSFSAATGFPSGPRAAVALAELEQNPATNLLEILPKRRDLRVSLYAGLYFFIGRHSGLIPYLPAALAFAFVIAGRRDRVGLLLLATTAVIAGFYAGWMPRYYFGGATAVGNRYFMSVYPAFLVALPSLPRRRQLILPWLMAAVVAGSAWVSMGRVRGLEFGSQTHAAAGIFRWLPYESVAVETEGARDRYWSGCFVRFVDPFAEIAPWHFQLRSDRPASELLVARNRQRTGQPIQFLVEADAPSITVQVSDSLRVRSFPLVAEPGQRRAHGLIALAGLAAWRSHAYWWIDGSDQAAPLPYRTSALRIAVTAADGQPVTAAFRFLVGAEPLAWKHDREVLSVGLPARATAGSVSRVPVRVRNTGIEPWSSAQVLPVELSYRIRRSGARVVLAEGERVAMPQPRVPPGRILQAVVPIRWPAEPGDYEVAVDLLVEGVAWFEDRLGAPLASATVRVESGG